MAEIKENKIIFNADDEEPQCHRCDNLDALDTFCINNCGGAHCWNGYTRTETIKNSN